MPPIVIEKIRKIFNKLFRNKYNVNETRSKKLRVKKSIIGLISMYFPIIRPKINGITILKAGLVFSEVNRVIRIL